MFTHGSATGLYVSLYQNDKFQWAAFPYELAQYIVPVKGMQTQADSINIKVYYLSGKILYEGKFYGEKNGAAKGCGLHKSYYENGEIRTVLDYNQDSITAYDNKGNMQHLKGIRKYRGEILQ